MLHECFCVFQSQVQRDPRDNDVINEYHEMSKATSIIHNLEPKGKEIGNHIFLICEMPTLFVFHHLITHNWKSLLKCSVILLYIRNHGVCITILTNIYQNRLLFYLLWYNSRTRWCSSTFDILIRGHGTRVWSLIYISVEFFVCTH